MKLKLQTQIISVVLIAGIAVSLVGSAYLWGKPLIEKRTTISEYLKAQNFILELDKKITEISNMGSGEASIDIPTGSLKLINYQANDPKNNTLILQFLVDQPMLLGEAVPIKTSSLGEIGVYGESEPRVIFLNSTGKGEKYLLSLELHYRELDTQTTPSKGYKIVLDGYNSMGKEKVMISFDKNEVVPGGAANGGDLILTHIRIDLY